MCVCFTTNLQLHLYILFKDEEEDDEEVYKMAGVMAQCGGLECMLNRLSGIKDFKQGRHLLTVRQQSFSLNKSVELILCSRQLTETSWK